MGGVSHAIDRVEVTFDEPNLVANAGLLMVATLVSRLGLEVLSASRHSRGWLGVVPRSERPRPPCRGHRLSSCTLWGTCRSFARPTANRQFPPRRDRQVGDRLPWLREGRAHPSSVTLG